MVVVVVAGVVGWWWWWWGGGGQQRAGVEGVNEVETLIGRGVTPSRPLTGTRLIHLNGHWRPTQTQTISSAG